VSEPVLVLAIDPNRVTPGVLGLVVVVALGIATWLLMRSMNRHLRRIDFDEGDPETEAGEPESPEPPVSR
jgi:hypothetical protein